MKTLLFYNGDNSIFVQAKVDIIKDDTENFTVMQVEGLTDEAVALGLDLKELTSNIKEMKDLATKASLNLKLVDINTGESTQLV